MKDHPRNPNEGVFAGNGLKLTLGYGIIITICVVISYFSCGFFKSCIYNFKY